MPFADLPECRLYFQEVDFTLPWTAAGPPVVFIHGLGGSWRNWIPQIPWVAQHRRVLAVDCRGAGKSTAPAHDWTVADMADDIFRLVDGLDIPSVALVGLSMGGTIALQFALDHGDRLAELVLVDTLAGLPEALQPMVEPSRDRIMTAAMPTIARERITAAFTDNVDPRLREYVIGLVAQNNIDHYRRAAAATFAFNVRDRLRGIRARTTIIFGSEDRVTPTVLGHDLRDHIPDASYHEIPGAGHISNLEFPNEFNAALANALGLPAPAPMASSVP